MYKIHELHHDLWQLCCINVYPSPFHQCKVTLNTISPRMKSTLRVEGCCPLDAGVLRYMDWEVSENQRYDRVLVSDHVSDGVGTWIGMYRRSQSTTVFLYRVRRNMDWSRYQNQYRDTSGHNDRSDCFLNAQGHRCPIWLCKSSDLHSQPTLNVNCVSLHSHWFTD